MEHFQATIRLLDVVEPDAATARRAIEEKLRIAGFARWQVLNVVQEGSVAVPTRKAARRVPRMQPSYLAGRALLVGAVLWSLWLLWLLMG